MRTTRQAGPPFGAHSSHTVLACTCQPWHPTAGGLRLSYLRPAPVGYTMVTDRPGSKRTWPLRMSPMGTVAHRTVSR
jgi:hypothetical protein